MGHSHRHSVRNVRYTIYIHIYLLTWYQFIFTMLAHTCIIANNNVLLPCLALYYYCCCLNVHFIIWTSVAFDFIPPSSVQCVARCKTMSRKPEQMTSIVHFLLHMTYESTYSNIYYTVLLLLMLLWLRCWTCRRVESLSFLPAPLPLPPHLSFLLVAQDLWFEWTSLCLF